MAYKHRVNTYHKTRKARKLKRFSKFVMFLAILAIVGVGVDWLLAQFRPQSNLTGVESRASVQSSVVNIFRTPYFQFQADRTWREVEIDQPNDTRYVYRSFDSTLVAHELIVEVNSGTQVLLDSESTAYVQPISLDRNTLRTEGSISPHCKEFTAVKGDINQQMVTHNNVTFPCNPDSSTFIVVAGMVGGSHIIEHRTDEGIRTYKITYRDSTFSPAGKPLQGILNTFTLL